MRYLVLLSVVVPAVLLADDLFATRVLRAEFDMEMAVYLAESRDEVLVHLKGPTNRWFAVGWGSDQMEGTYATIVNGNGTLQERKLGFWAPGSPLPSEFQVLQLLETNGIRSVWMCRDKTAPSEDFYDFTALQDGSVLDVIYARGQGPDFSYHGSGNKGTTSSTFAVPETTGAVERVTMHGGAATLTFTNLPPGRIRLLANTTLTDTNWNEKLSFPRYPFDNADLFGSATQQISLTGAVEFLRVE